MHPGLWLLVRQVTQAASCLQMLTAFEALTGGSVYLVLAWTVFVPPLMQTQQHLMRSGEALSGLCVVSLVFVFRCCVDTTRLLFNLSFPLFRVHF